MFLEIKYLFASFIFWILGWNSEKDFEKKEKEFKKLNKCLIIGEPHTSRLDFFMMIFMFWYYKIENRRFFINSKHMYPFLSIILDALGAITVKTNNKNGLVDEIVNEINRREKIFLQIGPSGTRKKTDRWRSGFYHIAHNANIPILCAYIDCKTKTFGIENPFKLTGNYKKDMNKIREIYKNKNGFLVENHSTICIKEESDEGIPQQEEKGFERIVGNLSTKTENIRNRNINLLNNSN